MKRPLPEGMRFCPTCNGTGINPVAMHYLCPKCNGEKTVPLPRRRFPRG